MLFFRAWYYFRQGWTTYFAFVFAAINTLTVTYYLAIEKIPELQIIFPSFSQYIIIVAMTGIPMLVVIGYAHFKRTLAYKSEAAVGIESNPYGIRNLINSEINLKLNLQILQILMKNAKNLNVSEKEIEEIKSTYNELLEHTKERSLTNKKDLKYFKEKMK